MEKTKPEKKIHTVPAHINPTTELKIGLPIDSNEYAASYLKNVTHGVVYQMKLLTWVTWKLMCQNNAKIGNWWLAAEVADARGFHDLVLKYDTPKTDGSTSDKKYMYRFMQIKHKRSLQKGGEITDYFLTSQNKLHRQGSLFYLFRAYLNMLGSFENITPDQIEDLTIFTNMNISGFTFLVPVKNDGLYDFEGKGKRYRLDTGVLLKKPGIMVCLYGILKKEVIKIEGNDEDIIRGFLRKLVFSVSQPPEHELEELIIAEMGKTFNTPQIFYDNLYKNIINWFLVYNGGKAPYLTENHVMKYLKETQDILCQAKNIEMLVEPMSKLSDKFKLLSL